MAFSIDRWARHSSHKNDSVPTLHSYWEAATLADIGAAGYLNAVADDLKIGDALLVKGSDGTAMRQVTAVTPDVTIGALAA